MRFAKAAPAAVAAAALAWGCAQEKPTIEVWKSASCGCCIEWVRYLETSGFQVRANNVDEPASYRRKLGVPDHLGSCHTAEVGGMRSKVTFRSGRFADCWRSGRRPSALPCRRCRSALRAWMGRNTRGAPTRMMSSSLRAVQSRACINRIVELR